MFLEISITSILFIFAMRTPRLFYTLHTKLQFVTLVIIALIFCTLFSGLGWLMSPLNWLYVLYTWLYSVGYLLLIDGFKVAFFAFYASVSTAYSTRKKRHNAEDFFKQHPPPDSERGSERGSESGDGKH